jgi:hypothetical protein
VAAHALGAASSEGFDIERAAHAALAGHRVGGEWFNVRADEAVAAIAGAAFRLRAPILQLTEDQARRDRGAGEGRGRDDGTAEAELGVGGHQVLRVAGRHAGNRCGVVGED